MKTSIAFSIVGLTLVAALLAACAGVATRGRTPIRRDDAAGSSLRHQRKLRRLDRDRHRDASSHATIPLGKRPRGIKVSPDGTTLYHRVERVANGAARHR